MELKLDKRRPRGVHRSKRVSRWQHFKENVWPSMGFKAWGVWLLRKLQRQAVHPHKLALGFALGVWINFTPILGTHFLLVLLLCYLFRANVVAAWAGTLIGNPWTYMPLWWASYKVGAMILPGREDRLSEVLQGFDWSRFWAELPVIWHDVLFPIFVGSVPLGGTLGVLGYGLVYWQVREFNKRRALKRALARGKVVRLGSKTIRLKRGKMRDSA